MVGQPGFFDVDERLKDISAKGDDLERLNQIVNFEVFRADLERAAPRSDRSKGVRPPYDHILMFKILILQASHSLSDERTEYLIKDRLSFMRFLGLSLAKSELDPELSRGADTGEDRRQTGDRGFVQALRRGADEGWLSRDGRTDHRRHDCRDAQAAQHRGRKEGHQRRAHSRGLDAQARQTAPEGSRCALDGQIFKSQAVRRRRSAST